MIHRLPHVFQANPKKVILQHFTMVDTKRMQHIADRVLQLTDSQVAELLQEVAELFDSRHKSLNSGLLKNYQKSLKYIQVPQDLTEDRKKLLGAYFSKEYSIQSAALFNPSIVPHPDQKGIPAGSVRVIISFRATGEGHISSVIFREGVIDDTGNVSMEDDSPYATTPDIKQFLYAGRSDISLALMESNYDIIFNRDDLISERTIFPSGPTESNGIEDVRFVRFQEDDKSVFYLGTYTAYDGHQIYSQIMQTTDFLQFQIRTLSGEMIKDKGMALFPRRVNGDYYMVSRLDGENLYIMRSKNLYKWDTAELLRAPQMPWEFVQIGNSGSPLETKDGWLLITHAVGVFRRYYISAILLDKEHPEKVIGYLPEPLLEPNNAEREGYVPNVVYSCGALLHNDIIILPYAKSDSSSGIATIGLATVLASMIKL
jgi:predicted GH43/DUF377 family glycosyl hydrolase